MSFTWKPRPCIRTATRQKIVRAPTPVPPAVAALVSAAVIAEVDTFCRKGGIKRAQNVSAAAEPTPQPPESLLTASEPESDDDAPVLIYEPPLEGWSGWRLPWTF